MGQSESQRYADEWSAWTIHDGRGCPLPAGTIVEVVSDDRFGFAGREMGQVSGSSESSWDWSHYPELKRIIRYRHKRPRGMAILREVLQTIDAPPARRPVSAQ